MPTDPIQAAKATAIVVGQVLDAARDNPQLQAAGEELGRAALTVGKTINNALLPLAAINFAFDKARDYFATKFSTDLGAKASRIPEDQVIEPKPSIAGPALQGLAFSHDEPELKDLYLELLTSSMDARRSGSAHPGFVEIIRQLTSGEARLLRGVLTFRSIPIVEIRLTIEKEHGWHTLQTHVADLRDQRTNAPAETAEFPAMVDNWIRLGLVQVTYSMHLQQKSSDPYAWAEERPELQRLRKLHDAPGQKVTFQRGIIAPTAFGASFAQAVGITGAGAPGSSEPVP